jgi:hypothetical protein
MKKILPLLLFLCQLFADENNIGGYWKSLNDETGVIECVVAVYPYEGRYYGRIITTYNSEGKMKESIYHPVDRAPGVVGNPYYCGLDLIWDLEDNGAVYKGKIIDPRKGNIYNSELWVDAGNLIIRGKLLFFGRNTTWYPATDADFPVKFQKPDLSKFIPTIPQVN